jgi:hypothetical protein
VPLAAFRLRCPSSRVAPSRCTAATAFGGRK